MLKDRKEFRDKLGEEEGSGIQLWFTIGFGDERKYKTPKKKEKRNLQYVHGQRKFFDMRKVRNFLGLGSHNYRGDHPIPDWTKRGVCTYRKAANLVLTRSRGKRALKPKILKTYEIQESF